MDNVRQPWRPWRSWSVIALVLIGLALVQACGKGGSSTGPSTTSSFQLKLRRAGGAELPRGCTDGTFAVIGPGGKILGTGSFGSDGKISVSVPVGQTVTIQVTVFCPDGTHTGSTTLTVGPDGVTGTIVINVSKVLGLSCSPSTVAPNQESTCTCNASSPGTPSITWTGSVSPKTGKTVKFKEANPGTYPVSCTVNGVDTKSTSVTVQAPEVLPPPPPPPPPQTGTITVNSSLEEQQGNLDVTFDGGLTPMNNIPPGGMQVKTNVPTGSYTATAHWCGECSCSVPFVLDLGENQTLTLPDDCD